MPADTLGRGHQLQQFLAQVHRLDRTEPQAPRFRLSKDQPQQVRQPHPVVPPEAALTAPAPEVDARHHNLGVVARQRAYLFEHLLQRHRAAAPAHHRNDAEAAAVRAPVLNLQVRPRPVAESVLHRRGKELRRGAEIADVDLPVIRRARAAGRGPDADQLWNARFVRVSDHPGDSGQPRQFLRRTLGVAARHQDSRRGVFPMHAVDTLAHVLVSRRGHRARVQNYHVGALRLAGLGQPSLTEQALQRGPVGLGRPAPEVLDEKPLHRWMGIFDPLSPTVARTLTLPQARPGIDFVRSSGGIQPCAVGCEPAGFHPGPCLPK